MKPINIDTLDDLLFYLKHGYTLDNKTDSNGAEHGNNGQFVSKGGSSGEKKTERLDAEGNRFELTSSGKLDFGYITKQMATAMGTNKAAPIRYSSGNSWYGKKHLEENHGDDLLGYFESSNDFVETMANNFDEIYQGSQEFDEQGKVKRNTFILTIGNAKKGILYIELYKNADDDYYSVNSGGMLTKSRIKQINPKNRLWRRRTQDAQTVNSSAGDLTYIADVHRYVSKVSMPTKPNKKETSILASDSKLSLNPGRFLMSGAETNQTVASDNIALRGLKIKLSEIASIKKGVPQRCEHLKSTSAQDTKKRQDHKGDLPSNNNIRRDSSKINTLDELMAFMKRKAKCP